MAGDDKELLRELESLAVGVEPGFMSMEEEEKAMLKELRGVGIRTTVDKEEGMLLRALEGVKDPMQEEEEAMLRALGGGGNEKRGTRARSEAGPEDAILAAQQALMSTMGEADDIDMEEEEEEEEESLDELRSKVKQLKKEALALKRNGDLQGARNTLREAKKVESILKDVEQRQQESMDLSAATELPVSAQVHRESDSMEGVDMAMDMASLLAKQETEAANVNIADDTSHDPDIMAEFENMQSLSIDKGSEEQNLSELSIIELKRRAVAAKRAGDIHEAKQLLKILKSKQASKGTAS